MKEPQTHDPTIGGELGQRKLGMIKWTRSILQDIYGG